MATITYAFFSLTIGLGFQQMSNFGCLDVVTPLQWSGCRFQGSRLVRITGGEDLGSPQRPLEPSRRIPHSHFPPNLAKKDRDRDLGCFVDVRATTKQGNWSQVSEHVYLFDCKHFDTQKWQPRSRGIRGMARACRSSGQVHPHIYYATQSTKLGPLPT